MGAWGPTTASSILRNVDFVSSSNTDFNSVTFDSCQSHSYSDRQVDRHYWPNYVTKLFAKNLREGTETL
jgi:hypothetical protein